MAVSARGALAAARFAAWRPTIAQNHCARASTLLKSSHYHHPTLLASLPATARSIHAQTHPRAQAATATTSASSSPSTLVPADGDASQRPQTKGSSNPALSFPCLDALDAKSSSLLARSLTSGPEPSYTSGHHEKFKSTDPLLLDWGGVLPEFTIAYETWGTLNSDKSNAILLHTGLSASSHAHSTPANPKPGWWERFIGPNAPLDTDKYFVICTNVIGSCYGSTGPSSIDPSDGKRYATRFPILTLEDMVRAQSSSSTRWASPPSRPPSAPAWAACISISGCARSHPYSIAMRHTQRQVLMMDPKWARGFYYDSVPPHSGVKLAREIATVTYRSGPEWEKRFGRKRADPSKQPALCPDFLIETYLDHAGEKFSLDYDPNSLLYVSKAMDLFDLGREQQVATAARRAETAKRIAAAGGEVGPILRDPTCSLTLPAQPYEEQPPPPPPPPSSSSLSSSSLSSSSLSSSSSSSSQGVNSNESSVIPQSESASQAMSQQTPPTDLILGLSPLKDHPILVMGVASDILFPAWQQREIAQALQAVGSSRVEHVELGEDISLFGHDTFLLDLENIGGRVGRFLG
ncbi:homoserine O-acetyltransferase [Paracoccidioides brasiliensis Pb18]|uniref:Homoserine O-acetyltransferase n=1 Tax=Paracoccidioides brasiliensis (strain Pb18) TaxID=502780 RepID=A0A0A0HQV9_PARBD|nr:homoserine O-acetyltransferase [Paracoccidioides brasiliensis Pb18]KGM91599.1 homoserine O-acetyltransferase [Paracoccidioides brasiliensis Pb18]